MLIICVFYCGFLLSLLLVFWVIRLHFYFLLTFWSVSTSDYIQFSGSPKRDHSSRGFSKVSNNERRNNDKVDDRRSDRSQHGRSSDSYRQSSRGNRHDEHSRSDYRDRESDYNRSKDRYRDVDRYPRDRSDRTRYDGRRGGRYDDSDRRFRDRDHHQDEKRDYRSFRGHQSDFNSKKDASDVKDSEGAKFNQEKSKNEGLDGHEEKYGRARGRSEERSAFVSEEFPAKRSKFSLGSDDRKGGISVAVFSNNFI